MVRLSWGLRWLVLLTVLAAIAGAATLGIGHFRYGTDRARETEFALADVHSAAFAANATQWSMIARRRGDRVDAAAFARSVAAIRTKLKRIVASDPAAIPVEARVSSLLERYDRAVAVELSALRNGDLPTAIALDRQRVDPTFDQVDGALSSAIAATEVRRAAAERHAILAARLIVIFAAISMLIAVGLFARARRRERERRFEADHDDLTGLLNRRGFFACLGETIAGRNSRVAVLLLDLDGFKEINDTLGHASGDELLRQIGARLRGALRELDEIARLGGDEFAVLVDAPRTRSGDVCEIGRRVRGTLTAPFEVAGLSLQVRASVGVAVFPEHGETADELLRLADIAMYQAKQNRTGLSVYHSSADPRSGRTLQLSSELERALDQAEFVVHYQPKANVHTGAVTGVEALVRWQHPERGLLAPDAFVPIAERNGLIRGLTLYVVRTALAQQSRWLAEGVDVQLAVNLSVANLLDADLPHDIAALLEDMRISPNRLKLEITESYLVTDPALIHNNIKQLCNDGVCLALDDFGTGYSSLTHLRRLPIDEIKIDRSFIQDLGTDSDDAAIVQSTIDLAHSLNLTVVAEGVESELTWNRLREFGCDQAQGYYLARPMPAQQLTGWLLNRAAPALRG
ncbi:MAG: putative bifunctional diguanylate cyclase/phosphodiesterase [Gaiellaceae bacterium]